MDVIKLYKDILASFGLDASTGFVKRGGDDVLIKGKKLALPTKEVVEDLYFLNGNDEYEERYHIFNPIYENLVGKDSVATMYLKKYIEHRTNFMFHTVGKLLLELYVRNPKDIGSRLRDFMILMESAKSGKVKKVVDDAVLKEWKKIGNELFKDKKYKLISMYLQKSVVKEGEKFYRGMVIDSPIMEAIKEGELDFGSKPNNVIKILVTFMTGLIDKDNDSTIAISSDQSSPTFMVLLKTWHRVSTEFNKLLKQLSIIDDEVCKSLEVTLKYDLTSMALSDYADEAKRLPYESSDGVIVEKEEKKERSEPTRSRRRSDLYEGEEEDDADSVDDVLDFIAQKGSSGDIEADIEEAYEPVRNSRRRTGTKVRPERKSLSSGTRSRKGRRRGRSIREEDDYDDRRSSRRGSRRSREEPRRLSREQRKLIESFEEDRETGLLWDYRIDLLFDDETFEYIDPDTMRPVHPEEVEELLEEYAYELEQEERRSSRRRNDVPFDGPFDEEPRRRRRSRRR